MGLDVLEQPLDVRKRIGYLPENVPLYLDMNVQEYLTFVGQARGLSGRTLHADELDWTTGVHRSLAAWHASSRKAHR